MHTKASNLSVSLDDTDKLLLTELSKNSRASASTLAEAVGLTRQAAAGRMERLQREGIIQGYSINIDPDKIGIPVRAFVSVTLMPACSQESEDKVIELLRLNPWVQECYRVTGQDYFQARVVAPEISALRELVVALRSTGVVQGTSTILALEIMFEKSHLGYAAM
jgi:Lrp/AsnC family leucine-responsive transcriptional regulator